MKFQYSANSKQNTEDYLESYDARFHMPPVRNENDDVSPDEEEIKADDNGKGKFQNWADRKLQWF
jgi:hypothetical protein